MRRRSPTSTSEFGCSRLGAHTQLSELGSRQPRTSARSQEPDVCMRRVSVCAVAMPEDAKNAKAITDTNPIMRFTGYLPGRDCCWGWRSRSADQDRPARNIARPAPHPSPLFCDQLFCDQRSARRLRAVDRFVTTASKWLRIRLCIRPSHPHGARLECRVRDLAKAGTRSWLAVHPRPAATARAYRHLPYQSQHRSAAGVRRSVRAPRTGTVTLRQSQPCRLPPRLRGLG
jgi:hypothetical protein